jgi:hypothetical protein
LWGFSGVPEFPELGGPKFTEPTHADFSDRLAIAIVQDLALYANSGGCLRSSLKCEGSGNEASKKDPKILH